MDMCGAACWRILARRIVRLIPAVDWEWKLEGARIVSSTQHPTQVLPGKSTQPPHSHPKLDICGDVDRSAGLLPRPWRRSNILYGNQGRYCFPLYLVNLRAEACAALLNPYWC